MPMTAINNDDSSRSSHSRSYLLTAASAAEIQRSIAMRVFCIKEGRSKFLSSTITFKLVSTDYSFTVTKQWAFEHEIGYNCVTNFCIRPEVFRAGEFT